MVKRDRRNIDKKVRVVSDGSIFNGREGIVKGFRGNYKKGIPYVQVYLYSTKSIWPFAGHILEYVKA